LRKKGPYISFKINDFIESEQIKRVRIFRATNNRDAVTVRNMTLVKELAIDEPLIDDFSDTTDLPYAEPLYYRLVALREITNEHGNTEYVPSKPSEISLTNIIDTVNPAAPVLTSTSDVYTAGDSKMKNIVLSWQKTVHNGKYILYKLNLSGNWTKIYEITTNDSNIEVALATTTFGSGDLEKTNSVNDMIYHHFKVVAVNSSNLSSREENILTL
jgi:hypothetical protein